MRPNLTAAAIVAACMLCSRPALAQWSVDRCMAYAIDHNDMLAIRRLDISLSSNDVTAAYGAFLPSVSARGKAGRRFGHSVDPSTNQYTSESFTESTVGLSISLSVFDGLTRIGRLRFARLNRMISRYAEQEAANRLALDVAEAFYSYCFDLSMHRLATEQRRLSESLYRQMAEYVELGMRARSDLQEVSARLEADRYQETVRANNSALSLSALKALMSMDHTDSLAIAMPAETDAVAPLPISLDGLYAASEALLPEFRAMELRERAASAQTVMAAGALYPSLRVEFDLNTGYYTSKDRNGMTASFGDQMRNNLNRYVGLSLSIPLLDGLTGYTGVKRQRIMQRRIKRENADRRLELRREIYDAYLSAEASYREYVSADAQAEASQAAWHTSEEKWREGLITLFEMLERRNDYMRAMAEKMRARLRHSLCEMTIHFYHTGSVTASDSVR